MAINKPELPNTELPETWGGIQTPYTEQQTQDGYPEAVPTVVDGGNLNYEKRGIFENIKFLKVFGNWLFNIPIDSVPVVNSQGQLDSSDLTDIVGKRVDERFQVVSSLPSNPDPSIFYYIPE
jgi:hypothetical protein